MICGNRTASQVNTNLKTSFEMSKLQQPSERDNQMSMTHAVDHYMDILYYLIVDPIYVIFSEMFDVNDGNMYNFQQSLKGVKEWNKSHIDSAMQNILDGLDWTKDDFDNLITAVFVGYSQMLTSVNLKNEPEDFVLRVPSYETFIHTIMVLSAQRIFKNPFIFGMGDNPVGCASYNRVEEIVRRSSKSAIYTLLPLKPILHYSNKEPTKSKKSIEDDLSDGSDYIASDSDPDDNEADTEQLKQIPLNSGMSNDGIGLSDGSGTPQTPISDQNGSAAALRGSQPAVGSLHSEETGANSQNVDGTAEGGNMGGGTAEGGEDSDENEYDV